MTSMAVLDKEEKTNKLEKKVNELNKSEKDLFEIEEVDIEEMAIDGICGVY